jgi:hypothetical protein
MHVHFIPFLINSLFFKKKTTKKIRQIIRHVLINVFIFLILGGNHTLSSTGTNDKLNDNNLPQEKLNEQPISMARLSRTTVSEEYDSDFDDSSHGDDEQITHIDPINEYDEEHQNQIIV